MHKQFDRPKVGVGVLVVQSGKILLAKRKSSLSFGHYGAPGGHLEYGETVQECATRELFEEAGLEALSIKLGPWTSDIFQEGKHYVTLFTIVDKFRGVPECQEPEKSESWNWYDWNDLPAPLMPSLVSLRKRLASQNEFLELLKVGSSLS